MSIGRRGVLIVIEGIDGSGKTCIAKELFRRLCSLKISTVYTHEPFTTGFSKTLKELSGAIRDSIVETLALAADRYVHIRSIIEPALRRGSVVICDRYYYSSIAYQGARGADPEWIRIVNRYVIRPDLAIYLDVEPEEGLKRRYGMKSEWPQFETIKIIERARQIYLDLVSQGELILVNAMRNFKEVVSDVWSLVEELLRSRSILRSL